MLGGNVTLWVLANLPHNAKHRLASGLAEKSALDHKFWRSAWELQSSRIPKMRTGDYPTWLFLVRSYVAAEGEAVEV